MPQHLTDRLEYCSQQITRATINLRTILRYLKVEPHLHKELEDLDRRINSARRVLQGAEAPTGKRGVIDYEAPIAEDDS